MAKCILLLEVLFVGIITNPMKEAMLDLSPNDLRFNADLLRLLRRTRKYNFLC